jgi:glycosyltransferase involved in cell wall biosynthesis
VGFFIDYSFFYPYFFTKKYMSKINVLVLPSDKSGVGKFRSVDPHVKLQNLYPNDFHVDIDYEPKLNDLNYWKKYQIVHFHRSFGNIDQCPELINHLKSMGIVVVGDLDDYWLPTKEHPIYQLIVENKMNQKILANLKVADYVITTTEIFATEIRKFHKNVVVLPNAIDPNEPQFNQQTLPSDKIRVGWLGGSSHFHDLKLLDGMVSKLSPIQDKLQYYVCGFDIRGSVTEINKQTGEQTQRPIKPQETVWVKYEEIFTNNYKIITPDYKIFLDKFEDGQYPELEKENYVRVWTRPVETYAGNYAKFDISLAPIKNHIFNRMKSQLKVIEAGFYKKAIIASNVGPYTIDLKHSLKDGKFTDGNALLVDEARNHSDWAKYVKKLVDNPNMITDLGERLYETVKDKYDLNQVTKTRAEFYKSLIK